MNPFVERLERLSERLEEVERLLSDPHVYDDRAKAAALQKERQQLEKIAGALRSYKRLLQDIAASETILNSSTDTELKYLADEELPALRNKLENAEANLKELLLPKDPDDSRNCIVEIRAGTGGDEAALFAADLFRMYSRYAERHRWKLEVIDFNDTGIGGFKEIIFSLVGDEAFGNMKYESGVHRVQRVPATETSGRIHTSAATVMVMPEVEDVDAHIEQKDLRIDIFRTEGTIHCRSWSRLIHYLPPLLFCCSRRLKKRSTLQSQRQA